MLGGFGGQSWIIIADNFRSTASSTVKNIPAARGVRTMKEGKEAMANLLVDERDIKFVLYEQLNIEELCESQLYSEFSREMFDMVLEAGTKLAEKELAPTNADGEFHRGKLLYGGP